MIQALLGEEALTGYWFDRPQEYAARCRREQFDDLRYATPESLTLDPLPCWKHLSPERYRARITAISQEIEAEAAALRKKSRSLPLGREAILRQHPHHRPEKIKKAPAPRIHAASQHARKWFYQIGAR